MKFTYTGAGAENIIKRYTREGNCYTVEYLDGHTSSYTSDNEEEARLNALMLEQAIDRDQNMDKKQYNFLSSLYTGAALISGTTIATAIAKTNAGASIVSALTLGLCSLYIIDNRKTVNDLKKYKMYLEMIKGGSYLENANLLDAIEYDHIYQIPLTINNLDKYSYRDIKVLYKNYKKTIKK